MWRELPGNRMTDRKICPVMSDSRGVVMCQGMQCAAAYTRQLQGETRWYCIMVDGPDPMRDYDQ